MVSRHLFAVVVVASLLLARAPARAHHAFDADFDEKNRVTLKGTITKVTWVNPHGWIYLDVTGSDGQTTNWAIETGAPAALARRGLTKNDLRVGSKIAVDGYRAKSKSATAAGRILTLADGTELFLR